MPRRQAGPDEAAAPQRVGPYRIVRELGRGGMGRVFLAEQETPDFKRTVALKLIHRPGPDEDSVRRFRAEVRILASLDHPGIVRFLDGGRSPEGVWFLALEYVEGADLLTHADQRELDIEGRVRIFRAVVEAVAFAHQRGVAHRDIKPANVLVARDGRPRLLDFGISKLLDSAATEQTAAHGFRPLTPAYASPEQRAGEPATAASDVYSLGVVLYELLSGRRPSGAGSGAASDSAPEPPSSARRRQAPLRRAGPTDPTAVRAPRRRIGRDLDAICLKTLARDPADRYASAAALLADLHRYLDALPIVALQDAWPSQVRRFLRRHRFGATAALAALGLVASLALALASGWRRDAAATRPSATSDPTPRPFPFDPTDLPSVEEAERRWAQAPGDLLAAAAVAMALADEKRFEEARFAIERMRQIPGKELDPLIDYTEGAIALELTEHQRALVLYTRGLESAIAQGRGELVGGIRLSRGTTLMRLGERDTARRELETACAELERAGDHALLQRAQNALALEYMRRGEMAASQRAFEKALDAARLAGSQGLVTRSNFAQLDLLRGRPDLAEARLREILEIRRQSPNPLREGQATLALAIVLRDLGRSAEASPLLERATELVRSGGSEVSLGAALYERALADLESARLEGLAGLAEEIEAISRTTLHRRTLGYAHSVRARLALLRGELPAARTSFGDARRLLLSNGDRDLAATSDLAWAEAESRSGDVAAASRVLDEALAALEHPQATLPGFFAELLRARYDAAAGRSAEARRRLEALGDAAASPSVSRRLAFLGARAALATAEGRRDRARADLAEALQLARRAGRKVAELELRLELAKLESPAGGRPSQILEIEREATALGLLALAEQTRSAGRDRTDSVAPR